jgi:hypothetical protein
MMWWCGFLFLNRSVESEVLDALMKQRGTPVCCLEIIRFAVRKKMR